MRFIDNKKELMIYHIPALCTHTIYTINDCSDNDCSDIEKADRNHHSIISIKVSKNLALSAVGICMTIHSIKIERNSTNITVGFEVGQTKLKPQML